jgi:hypothetical protein
MSRARAHVVGTGRMPVNLRSRDRRSAAMSSAGLEQGIAQPPSWSRLVLPIDLLAFEPPLCCSEADIRLLKEQLRQTLDEGVDGAEVRHAAH